MNGWCETTTSQKVTATIVEKLGSRESHLAKQWIERRIIDASVAEHEEPGGEHLRQKESIH